MTESVGTIRIKGLRAMGTHGVLAEEKSRSQVFEVDIEIVAPVEVAGKSDSLSDTIDYSVIATRAKNLVETGSVELIETLAERICSMVLAEALAERATVVVRKLHPPIEADVKWVEAEISKCKTLAG